jgi:hypothetical protein
MFELILPIVFLLVTAVVMYFVGSRVPIIADILNIIAMVYFLGLFLSLQNITVVSELIAKLPYMEYVLSFNVGTMIGRFVAKYIPFI